MNEDFLKIIGVIVVIGFILYLASKSINLQKRVVEGLTNPSTTTTSTGANGQAGSAAAYAASIQAQVTQMNDTLLITQYRSDYENIIINMSDYFNLLILQGFVNLNTSSSNASTNIDAINNINSLYSAIQTLNSTMKFIDSV